MVKVFNLMKDTKHFTKITFPDGSTREAIFYSMELLNDSKIVITGKLLQYEENNTAEKVELPTFRIRNYSHKSALVRFLYNGKVCTAAITHTTDKAWRMINTELGVAWVPKNILRWSEIAGQFCVIDETYTFDFTYDVHPGMSKYPLLFDPDELIVKEL